MKSPKEIIENNDIKGLGKFFSDGADVNAIYEKGETALIMASRIQSVEAVRLLLTLGANTLIRDDLGSTAKKTAYWYGEYRNGSYTEECKEIVNLILNVQMKGSLVED